MRRAVFVLRIKLASDTCSACNVACHKLIVEINIVVYDGLNGT